MTEEMVDWSARKVEGLPEIAYVVHSAVSGVGGPLEVQVRARDFVAHLTRGRAAWEAGLMFHQECLRTRLQRRYAVRVAASYEQRRRQIRP
jgi:hypothetical protein